MRIPLFLLKRLRTSLLKNVREDRKYFHLPSDADPSYMERYWVKRPKITEEGSFGRDEWAARIHIIKSSDRDRHLHDHPWWNISLILEGSYVEEIPWTQDQEASLDSWLTRYRPRKPGDIIVRKATDRHKLHLVTERVVSLFIMGPVERMWGFHTEEGFVPFREYLNKGE